MNGAVSRGGKDDSLYIGSSGVIPPCRGATPRDHRVLPKRIILVRHAESQGNIDHFAYSEVPDPQICLVRSPPELSVPLLELLLTISEEACNALQLCSLVSAFTHSPCQRALSLL